MIYKEPPRVIDGYFQVSDKPGLQLELDPKVLKKYKIA
jgi:L-alanine-DL-glutamate epimerase-like enolase superfamily enzyme